MATTAAFPLATEPPVWDGPDPESGSDAGASGHSTGSVNISRGAMVAIIVIVTVVAVVGSKPLKRSLAIVPMLTCPQVASSILFFVAKKREWKVRETVRRSARKVVTALTPRRSEFPKAVKESGGRGRAGRVRLDDVPPTPRIKPEDLEKGFTVTETKRTNFSRK